MTKLSCGSKKGFTLLEVLLVIGIIAILAGIVILAINPGKQLADARNAQRRSDVNTILNGIYQYAVDNSGTMPATLVAAVADDDACYTMVENDYGTVNANSILASTLTELTDSGTYLSAMPVDPTSTVGGSDYIAVLRTTGRITVCAPNAENNLDPILEVTR